MQTHKLINLHKLNNKLIDTSYKLINLHKLNNKLINTSYNQKVLKLPCVKNSNSLLSPLHSPPYDICDWQWKLYQN